MFTADGLRPIVPTMSRHAALPPLARAPRVLVAHIPHPVTLCPTRPPQQNKDTLKPSLESVRPVSLTQCELERIRPINHEPPMPENDGEVRGQARTNELEYRE